MANCPDEEIFRLIETYRLYSVLWDPKHENHFKKNVKEDIWRDIGAALGRPMDECKKKMIALLGSYRREKSKEKRSCTTGKGATEVYKSRWFAYEALAFLRDRDEPRRTLNTETEIADNRDTESEENREINQSATESEESFSTPKPPKRAKLKERNQSSNMMTSAFRILQTAADKLNAPLSEDDEVTSFFKYVTTKVKTYSSQTKREVQQAVFDILMKADRGFYEWTSENAHYGYQQPSPMYNTPPTTGLPLQPASVFPTNPSQPQLTQLTTAQGVPTVHSSIHAETCPGTSNDSTQFSTISRILSPSQQSNISVGSDDFEDYV